MVVGAAALTAPTVVGILNPSAVRAQSPQGAPASAAVATAKFEVTSVKPCGADVALGREGERKGGNGQGGSSPDRLHLSCQTVMSLVQWAYVNFSNDRFNPLAATPISGGPAWINSDLYEIDAKAEGRQTRGTMNGFMLRALLEDRFKLKTHRETRQVPVYALTVAKGGPKLQRFREGSCVPFDRDHPLPPPEPGKPFPRTCGMSQLTSKGFDAYGVTMPDFCRLLSDSLDRTAVDKTGVAGKFDIHLDLFPADLGHPVPGVSDPGAPATLPDAGDISFAVRTALQKLGLKLQAVKGPGEFLVIDGVSRPSQN